MLRCGVAGLVRAKCGGDPRPSAREPEWRGSACDGATVAIGSMAFFGPTTTDVSSIRMAILDRQERCHISETYHNQCNRIEVGARKLLILKRRDGRVVDGARLENESGDAHRVIPKHSFTQSIQRLPAAECLSM